jgi:hypothetical protein
LTTFHLEGIRLSTPREKARGNAIDKVRDRISEISWHVRVWRAECYSLLSAMTLFVVANHTGIPNRLTGLWGDHLCLTSKGVTEMSIGTILLVILILMLLGAVPAWPHSRSWGYGPSGGLGLIVVILLILVLMRAI